MRKLTQEEFIGRAKNRHADKYDYSQTVYTKSHATITVICPEHGPFEVPAYRHLSHGCCKCGNVSSTAKRKTTVPEFIERAREIHGETYDYSRVAFGSQHDRISIVCPSHGVFEQAVNDHLKGHGCSACAYETNGAAQSLRNPRVQMMNAEEFVRKSRIIHGDAFSYSRVNYRGVRKKVVITCDHHGPFEQLPSNHLAGHGCPKCANHGGGCGIGGPGRNRIPFDEFCEQAKRIHNDKYEYVSYLDGYAVDIICDVHGKFSQRVADHLNGSQCPSCARKQVADRLKLPEEEFVAKLREKFNDRIELVDGYDGLGAEAKFSCIEHGEFQNTPGAVIKSKYGCQQCSNFYGGMALRLTHEEFLGRAIQLHDGKYTYLGTFEKTTSKIAIECPLHGVFYQNVSNHLSGYGCPKCASRTKKQNRWLDSLGVKEREFRVRIGEKVFIVDGIDPKTNTIYEFWGDFWHGNPSKYDQDEINTVVGETFGCLYNKTQEKRRLIVDAGYTLVDIWESKWDKICQKL